MKTLIQFLLLFSLTAGLSAQQPQSGTAPILGNARYVQGVGPGYYPRAGSGLTLTLTAGTANCSGTRVTYAGGTLTMSNNTTNQVYLDTASSCVPAKKTTGYVAADIFIATVVTSGGVITTISDDRTMQIASSGAGATGDTITLNGVATGDANFNNTSPPPPSGASNGINVIWDKTGSGPTDVSARIMFGNSLAIGGSTTLGFNYASQGASPSLGAGECVFDATVPGLACEGATANTIETRIAITEPTASDKTFTIPNADSNAVQPLDCGTDFVKKIDSAGLITCATASAGAGTVTNIATTAPIAGGPITGTGTITCNVASGSQPGCLASADWTTFNNKGSGTVTAVTGSGYVASSGGTTPDITVQEASATQGGVIANASQTIPADKIFAGKVSAGVGGPLYTFHVHTGTDENFVVRHGTDLGAADGTTIQSSNDADDTNKTLVLVGNPFVFLGGSVGIGDYSPDYSLDVTGYVNGSTGLCIADDCKTAWPAGTVTSVSGTANEIGSTGGATPVISIAATPDLSGKVLLGGSPLVFEGTSADAFETSVVVTDPTVDRNFTIPNADSVATQPLTCSGTDRVSAVSALGVITCSATGSSSSVANLQIFNLADTGTNWTLPTNGKIVVVTACAAGGGGGGGSGAAVSNIRAGGAGGGGGFCTQKTFRSADIASPVLITVGAGGTAGTGGAGAQGGDGGVGNNSSFGTYIIVYGGGGGAGNGAGGAGGGGGGCTTVGVNGTGATGVAGGDCFSASAATTSFADFRGGGSTGSAGAGGAAGASYGGGGSGSGSSSTGAVATVAGGTSKQSSGGGGLGGGVNAANPGTAENGAAGGGAGPSISATSGGGGAAGLTASACGAGGEGQVGTATANTLFPGGTGGGGGASKNSTTGCVGGTGGVGGGGAGGGGGGTNTGGNGGTGGAGYLAIWTYF